MLDGVAVLLAVADGVGVGVLFTPNQLRFKLPPLGTIPAWGMLPVVITAWAGKAGSLRSKLVLLGPAGTKALKKPKASVNTVVLMLYADE